MIKHFIAVMMLLPSISYAFDHNVVKGQWAVYHNNLIEDDYYYFLSITDDYSGVLVRSLGHEPITRKFSIKDVSKRDGYIEIKLAEHEKAVLSAWKLKSGSGRLTGQIFMYKQNGELFNMLYFPLQLLEHKHDLFTYDEIKRLSEQYK